MKKSDKCATPGCKNQRYLKYNRKICKTCDSRIYRQNNPLVSTYHRKKSQAKSTDIPFTLTLAEFKKFCDDTGYLELKGNGTYDLNMDRKIVDPYLGYTATNIQALTKIENVRKGQIEKRMRKDWGIKGLGKQPGDPF